MKSPIKARENPFAVDRVQKFRYRLQQGTWDDLLNRLAELDNRAALVGPHGAGKSTLLEDLGERLEKQGRRVHWIRLNEQNRKIPNEVLAHRSSALESNDVVLLDGAEQLRSFAWQRFKHRVRKAGGLIVTTHRPGRLPTLIDCATTPYLLEELVRFLLDDRPEQEWNDACRETICRLFDKHHGNLRDAVRDLYDQFARGEDPFLNACRPGT